MVRSCSLKNCNNSVKQKYRFFILPSVKKVAKREAWLEKCGDLLPEPLPAYDNSISLCEGHFQLADFIGFGLATRSILKPTAVPTIFIPNPPRISQAMDTINVQHMNDTFDELENCPRKWVEHDHMLYICGEIPKQPETFRSYGSRNKLHEIKNNYVDTATSRGKNIIPIAKPRTDTIEELDYFDSEVTEEVDDFSSDYCRELDRGKYNGIQSSANPSSGFDFVSVKSANDSVKQKVDRTENAETTWKTNNDIDTRSIDVEFSVSQKLKSPANYSRFSVNTCTLMRIKMRDLEMERDAVMRKNRQLSMNLETLKMNLRSFLNDDQIRRLVSGSPSSISWSPETLEKSGRIRSIVGVRAYDYLRKKANYPLPSSHSLLKHKDVSKVHEYTREMIEEHLNTEESKIRDNYDAVEEDFEEEHVKIEPVQPDEEVEMEFVDTSALSMIIEKTESIINDNTDEIDIFPNCT